MDIRDLQQRAWANKQAKGFNTTNIALEFGLLNAEVGEAFTAWIRKQPDIGEELADIVIYAAGLAQMLNIDLAQQVSAKLDINANRVYQRDAGGVLRKVAEQAKKAKS